MPATPCSFAPSFGRAFGAAAPSRPAIVVRLAADRVTVAVPGAVDVRRADPLHPLPVAWAVGLTVADRDAFDELEVDDLASRARRCIGPDTRALSSERFPVLRALLLDDGDEELSDEAIATFEATVHAAIAAEDDAADLAADLAAIELERQIAEDWTVLRADFGAYAAERRAERAGEVRS